MSGILEEMVERGKEIQSVQHILINMGKDNNSRTENNMYICTLSGMFEEMVKRGKEITLIYYTLVKQKLTLFATLLDSLDSG